MTLVDSHCHLNMLDLTAYNGDLDALLDNARKNGVNYFLCVCTELNTFPQILILAEKYPDVTVSIGIHPTEIVQHEPTTDQLCELAQHPKVIAFGETGLDYYREATDKALQQERLRRHIRAAKQIKKPLIIHTRQARTDTIQILKEENADAVGGVMHCFTEDWTMAQQALDLNFYISFSGIVTFRNAQELKDIAVKVPLDRMLIETDSPFLAPIPYRGKPNEPAYVRFVAEHIAELRGISFEEVAKHTTENFFRLFGRVGKA
jgi:TatD DNase family protein